MSIFKNINNTFFFLLKEIIRKCSAFLLTDKSWWSNKVHLVLNTSPVKMMSKKFYLIIHTNDFKVYSIDSGVTK